MARRRRRQGRQFYNVFFPHETVTTKDRFFFFKTLLSDNNHPEYNELGEAAQKVITSGLSEIEDDRNEEGQIRIMHDALNFLDIMIRANREEEIKFFEDNIEKNPALMKFAKEALMSCYTRNEHGGIESIDYINFMKIINELLIGSDNFKATLEYESKRLHEFNNQLKIFKDKLEHNQISGSNRYRKKYTPGPYLDSDKTKDRRDYDNQILYMFDQYLKDPKVRLDENLNTLENYALKNRLSNTQTLEHKLQTSLAAIFQKVWNENSNTWEKTLSSYFKKDLDATTDLAKIEKVLTADLINKFVDASRAEIVQILDSQQQGTDVKPLRKGLDKKMVENLATNFLKTIYFTGSDDEKELLYVYDLQQILHNTFDSIVNQQEYIEDAEERYNKVFKDMSNIFKGTKKDATHTRATISGMNKKILAFLEKYFAQNKNYKPNTNNKFETRRSELLKFIVNECSINTVSADTKDLPKSQQRKDYGELAQYLNDILVQNFPIETKFTNKDPYISESGGGAKIINFAMRKMGTAMTSTNAPYIKSDNAFLLNIADITCEVKFNSEKVAKVIAEHFKNTLPVLKLDIQFKNGTKFSEKDFRDLHKVKSTEFSIEAETEKQIALLAEEYNILENQLIMQGEDTETIKKALEKLSHCLSVRDSVKNYDQYDNEHGFKGGSLGGDLEAQVKNICSMMETGHISPPDRDWLLFSIYNSGPGLVGGDSEIKNSIENIFSTVASMLLFEDSGIQAQMILNEVKQKYTKHSISRNFLHIFILNGVYVPQSYVLQLTYDALVRAQQDITMHIASTKTGSRANVLNSVNITDMAGTKSSNGYKYVTSPQDWYDTFKNNRRVPYIQLTFLAGFLDIIDAINSAMTKIN